MTGRVLRTPEAAKYCGLKPQTLYNLKSEGKGPQAYKHGRITVYYPADLDRWLSERLVAA